MFLVLAIGSQVDEVQAFGCSGGYSCGAHVPRCEPVSCTVTECDDLVSSCHWNQNYCDEGFQSKSCRGDTSAACLTSDGCGSESCSGPIPADSCSWTDPPGGGGSSSASPSPSPTPVTCSYSSCNTDLNQCQTHDNQAECSGGGCSCYSNTCSIDDDCRVTKLEVISRTVNDPNATCGQIAAAGAMSVVTNVHIVGPGGSNVNGNYGISPTQYTLDNATVGDYAIGQGSSTPSGYDATPIFCNGGSRSVGSVNAAVTQDHTTTVYAAFVRRGNLNMYAKGISVAPALMTCNNF